MNRTLPAFTGQAFNREPWLNVGESDRPAIGEVTIDRWDRWVGMDGKLVAGPVPNPRDLYEWIVQFDRIVAGKR